MAKENWKPMNLIRENLVKTSTYALKTVRTDAEGRGKKSQYGREGNPGCVLCVSFSFDMLRIMG